MDSFVSMVRKYCVFKSDRILTGVATLKVSYAVGIES